MGIKATCKKFALVASIPLAATVIPTWTSFQHDMNIHMQFRKEFNQNQDQRLIKIETEGVVREGYLSRGVAMPNINIGVYAFQSKALVAASSEEAACWYANLRVVDGRENLPVAQKIMNGSEYVWAYSSPSFNSLTKYHCAPVLDKDLTPNP